MMTRRVLIMGAAGRDFHNFNVKYRDDPAYEVVAFTATQIPGIEGRRYPAELAGSRYSNGIPIYPEQDLGALIGDLLVDEVVFAYSDVSHEYVMHEASRVLASGADFTLLGPESTYLDSKRKVIAVCATRTGSGKSATSLHVARLVKAARRKVAAIRHPMPYGDLVRQAVQRFARLDDLAAADCTIEEREEYTPYVRAAIPIHAGVDYARILEQAEGEADVIVWDGGNNDLPFVRPDLHVVVFDPLRVDDGVSYHPGEANLRMADVVVISKADTAGEVLVERTREIVRSVNSDAQITAAGLRTTVADVESLRGKRAVVVGDGPTLTHGGMPSSAGTVAAKQHAIEIVDPRPYLVGAVKQAFEHFPHLALEVPAMGYGEAQVRDLEATLRAVPADFVLSATPIGLAVLIDPGKPIVDVDYALDEWGDTLTQAVRMLLAT